MPDTAVQLSPPSTVTSSSSAQRQNWVTALVFLTSLSPSVLPSFLLSFQSLHPTPLSPPYQAQTLPWPRPCAQHHGGRLGAAAVSFLPSFSMASSTFYGLFPAFHIDPQKTDTWTPPHPHPDTAHSVMLHHQTPQLHPNFYKSHKNLEAHWGMSPSINPLSHESISCESIHG